MSNKFRHLICGGALAMLASGMAAQILQQEPTDQLRADFRNEVPAYTNQFGGAGITLGIGSGWNFAPEADSNVRSYEQITAKIFDQSKIPHLQSTIGVPTTTEPADVMLGEVIEPPSDWNGAAPTFDKSLGDRVVWIDYAKKLIAADAGPVRIYWPTGPGTTNVQGKVISASPAKRPVRLYWTHKRPKSVEDTSYEALQNSGPTVTFSSNYRVDLYPSSTIKVWDGVNTVGDVRLNGTELQAFEGNSGSFLLTYSRLDEATNKRVLLAYEVVNVLEPTQTQIDIKIGQQLRPISRSFDTNELFPKVTRGLTDDTENGEIYVYQHSAGAQKNYLWAIRDSSNDPWKIEVFWRAKEELDVIWPFEVDIYAAEWDKAGAQVYLRDCASSAGGQCPAEPVVHIPSALVATPMEYQVPQKHLIANNGSIYSTYAGTNAYALVKYSSGETVWFQTIHSVPHKDVGLLASLGCDLAGAVSNDKWWTGGEDEERPQPEDLTTAVLAEEIRAPFAGAEGWFYPGWIHLATNRVEGFPIINPFNAQLYSYPTEYTSTNEVYAPIFPVNLGQIEVWWMVASSLNGEQEAATGHKGPVPTPLFFPAVPVTYTVQPPDETYRWDNGVPQIVIASGQGSKGWALSDYDPWVASPTISFDMAYYGTPDYLLQCSLTQNGLPDESRVLISTNFTVEARFSFYQQWHFPNVDQVIPWVSFYNSSDDDAYLRLAFDARANLYIDGEKRTNFKSVPVEHFGNRSDDMSATQFHLALTHGDNGVYRYYVNGMRVAEFVNTNANAAAAMTFDGGYARLFERGEMGIVVDKYTGYMSNFRVWCTERSWQNIDENRYLELTNAVPEIVCQLGEQARPITADSDQWAPAASLFKDTSMHGNSFYLGYDPEEFGDIVKAGLYSGAPLKPRQGLVFGANASIYVQNEYGQPGYNPNEECALMVGTIAHALECGKNITTVIPLDVEERTDTVAQFSSLPYVLVQYADPDRGGRYRMAALRVIPENDMYRFRQFREAGTKITPPAPITSLQPANLLKFKSGPRLFTKEDRVTLNDVDAVSNLVDVINWETNSPLYLAHQDLVDAYKKRTCFKDRKGWFWAHQAGDNGGPTNYVFEISYPWQPSFADPLLNGTHPAGTETVWMRNYEQRDDGYLGAPSRFPKRAASDKDGIDYTYIVEWPRQPPKLYINQTLYKAVNGLPAIDGQLSVGLVYEQSDMLKNRPSVQLLDPIRYQTGSLTNIPDGIKWYEDTVTSCRHFENAPPYVRERFKWNPNAVHDLAHGVTKELELNGEFIDEAGIDNYLWLNVMDQRTRKFLTNPDLFPGGENSYWQQAILAMPTNVYAVANEDVPHDHLALATTGKGAGWVTVVMNNSTDTDIVPSSEEVFMYTFKVEPELYVGTLHPILSDNPLDKLQDMKYTADFNGKPEQWEFEWIYSEPMANGKADELPKTNSVGVVSQWNSWLSYGENDNATGEPRTDWISVGDNGPFGLSDHYISCRYRARPGTDAAKLCGLGWTPWTKGQLAEGWIKRVLKAINPFEQRCMEYASKASSKALNTQLSMLQQAGAPYDGDVPLNQFVLDDYGLLQFYETVLHQARMLSIDNNETATGSLSLALQMAAGRIAELYMVLGNEALADAMNPTVDLGNNADVPDGAESSIFPFMNQCENLLDEELCLLRGRDLSEDYAYAARNNTEPWAAPYYNRLIWNFSSDIMGGQVAYVLNYGISDLKGDNNGMTDVNDAIALYPQGHGDAYGHYLSAVKGYYSLLRHKNFGWPSQVESVLAYGGSALITMSYMHEKRFAMAAAAKARTAEMIVSRTARQRYQQGAQDPWMDGQDYKIEEFTYEDGTVDSRHWGTDEWATRGHLGAYYDWVVVNSVLPSTQSADVGILQMIDRESTLELSEIAGYAKQIQQTADRADSGMNPLGLADAAVPFDIAPSEIDEGKTHFEQIYARALKATTVAHEVFKRVKSCANALRDQNENRDFDTMVADEEAAINRELIEIYGRPYAEDCGPGKIYEEGYTGPDLKHYYYVETYDVDNSNTNGVKGRYMDLVINDYKLITTNCTGTFEAEFNKDVDADGILNKLMQGAVKIYNTALNHLSDKLDPILKYGGVAVEDYLELPASMIDTGTDQYDGKVDYDFAVCAWSNFTYNASYFVGIDGFTPKPYGYTSQRPAEGSLQIALTGYQEKLSAVEQEQANVRAAADGIRQMIDELWAKDYETQMGYVKDAATNEVANYYAAVKKNADTIRDTLTKMKDIKSIVTEAVVEGIPKVIGVATDALSSARGVAMGLLAGLQECLDNQIKEQEEVADKIKTETEKMQAKLAEQYKAYQDNEDRKKKIAAVQEKSAALYAAISKLEVVLNAANAQRMQYAQLLEKGKQLQNERARLRVAWASDLSLQRYRNMFYQILRNDELQRYNEAFESAAKYVYLAAKAYDYETGLLQSDSKNTAGREFMGQIIKARALGRFSADGTTPLGGGSAGDPGLADVLYRMNANWQVLKGRLGFNNPQNETDGFSLRKELFRKNDDAAGDAAWAALLGSYWVADLRSHPAFARYAQPFDPMQASEPGYAIPFRTEITARNGFFGNPLQAGDNSFSSTYFATKIRGVGVWLEGEKGQMANRPEVYLIPAGLDYMRVPVKSSSSDAAEIRSWNVVDQVLPIPYPLSDAQWASTDWSMMKDIFDNELCTQRRHPSIRASVAPTFEESAMSYNSRLIGRSVWNDQWWLIIPAASLNSDNATARANFEQTIKDIHLYFKTYSFSGN